MEKEKEKLETQNQQANKNEEKENKNNIGLSTDANILADISTWTECISIPVGFQDGMYKNDDYDITNNKCTITRTTSQKFSTAIIDWPILKNDSSSSIVSWDIEITALNKENNCFIGITEYDEDVLDETMKHAMMSTYIGENRSHSSSGKKTNFHAYGYYACSKQLYYCETHSSSKSYGKTFTESDVVTVTINFVEDTLRFSVNGEDQGIAKQGGLAGRTWYPAVSLYVKGDSVTLISDGAQSTCTFVTDDEIEDQREKRQNQNNTNDTTVLSHRKMPVSGCYRDINVLLPVPITSCSYVDAVEIKLGTLDPSAVYNGNIYNPQKTRKNKYHLLIYTIASVEDKKKYKESEAGWNTVEEGTSYHLHRVVELVGIDITNTKTEQRIELNPPVAVVPGMFLALESDGPLRLLCSDATRDAESYEDTMWCEMDGLDGFTEYGTPMLSYWKSFLKYSGMESTLPLHTPESSNPTQKIPSSVWLKFYLRYSGIEMLGIPSLIHNNQTGKNSLRTESEQYIHDQESLETKEGKVVETISSPLMVALAKVTTITLIIQCWSHRIVLNNISLNTSTEEIKKLICSTIGMEVSPEKQFLYVATTSGADKSNGTNSVNMSKLDQHPFVIGRIRHVGFMKKLRLICIVPKIDYQASGVGTPRRRSSPDKFHLNKQASLRRTTLPRYAVSQLFSLMVSSPFRNEEIALTWNSCFRLMCSFYTSSDLVSSSNFYLHFSRILRSALVAPQALASIVEDDLLKLLHVLLDGEGVSLNQNGPASKAGGLPNQLQLQGTPRQKENKNKKNNDNNNNNNNNNSATELKRTITSAAVETFTIASRLNGSLYGRVLAVLCSHIQTTGSWIGIEASQLGRLLVDVSMAVTTEAGDPSAVSANEIRVMIEAIRYINTTLECASQDIDSKTSNEARNVRVGLLRNIMSTGGRSSVAARRLLEWMSTNNNQIDIEKTTLRAELGNELVKMFGFVISLRGDLEVNEVIAFIDLVSDVLRTCSNNSSSSNSSSSINSSSSGNLKDGAVNGIYNE